MTNKLTQEIRYGHRQVPINEMPVKDIRSALVHLRETNKTEISDVSKPMLEYALRTELNNKLSKLDERYNKKFNDTIHITTKLANNIEAYFNSKFKKSFGINNI